MSPFGFVCSPPHWSHSLQFSCSHVQTIGHSKLDDLFWLKRLVMGALWSPHFASPRQYTRKVSRNIMRGSTNCKRTSCVYVALVNVWLLTNTASFFLKGGFHVVVVCGSKLVKAQCICMWGSATLLTSMWPSHEQLFLFVCIILLLL